jgi:hypothetical protein
MLSLNKIGCPWRERPQEDGNWSTINGYCQRWWHTGVWTRLREGRRQWEPVLGTPARILRWPHGCAEHQDGNAKRGQRL